FGTSLQLQTTRDERVTQAKAWVFHLLLNGSYIAALCQKRRLQFLLVNGLLSAIEPTFLITLLSFIVSNN
ncbi:TPA: hypothetical protein ACJOGX_005218, partial [Enterobacter kobei]